MLTIFFVFLQGAKVTVYVCQDVDTFIDRKNGIPSSTEDYYGNA
ncbi:hypothetical protein [Pedobacter miscanthi]|nr:hypothetical protein [Pedobacter miscanthi]